MCTLRTIYTVSVDHPCMCYITHIITLYSIYINIHITGNSIQVLLNILEILTSDSILPFVFCSAVDSLDFTDPRQMLHVPSAFPNPPPDSLLLLYTCHKTHKPLFYMLAAGQLFEPSICSARGISNSPHHPEQNKQ